MIELRARDNEEWLDCPNCHDLNMARRVHSGHVPSWLARIKGKPESVIVLNGEDEQ